MAFLSAGERVVPNPLFTSVPYSQELGTDENSFSSQEAAQTPLQQETQDTYSGMFGEAQRRIDDMFASVAQSCSASFASATSAPLANEVQKYFAQSSIVSLNTTIEISKI